MMRSDDKVGGWVKKGQNHDDVILECPPAKDHIPNSNRKPCKMFTNLSLLQKKMA